MRTFRFASHTRSLVPGRQQTSSRVAVSTAREQKMFPTGRCFPTYLQPSCARDRNALYDSARTMTAALGTFTSATGF
eukprot:5873815-Pleurochrysis_carterae.AAC.3